MNTRAIISKLPYRTQLPHFSGIRPSAGLISGCYVQGKIVRIFHCRKRRQEIHQLRCFSTGKTNEQEEKNTPVGSKPSKPVDNVTSPTKPGPLSGLALATGTAVSGFALASAISAATQVPLSGIPVSIVLGMALRTGAMPQHWQATLQPGLTLASKSILQFGIVCVGIKLSIWQLATASTTSVPVVLAAVSSGMVGIPRIAAALGVNSPHLVPLMTAGTSICGVTAISALAPAISAPHKDVAVAVANTVAFGTIGMLAYPYILNGLIGTDSSAVGLCLGVAIHDTSQVLGAALSYKEAFGDEVAFELAAVTKLVRNLGLAAAIPYLTYQYQRNQSAMSSDETNPGEPIKEETISGLATFTKIVPPFLVAFIGMSVLRSVGDVAIGSETEVYNTFVSFIGNDLSKYALGTAMAATGLSIDANSLRTVGWRPFALGGASAALVGGVGFGTALAVSYASTTFGI